MALAGFLALSLLPSFMDWQQAKGDRKRQGQFIAAYAVALGLIYVGLLRA